MDTAIQQSDYSQRPRVHRPIGYQSTNGHCNTTIRLQSEATSASAHWVSVHEWTLQYNNQITVRGHECIGPLGIGPRMDTAIQQSDYSQRPRVHWPIGYWSTNGHCNTYSIWQAIRIHSILASEHVQATSTGTCMHNKTENKFLDYYTCSKHS